jgi:hypothetical protein
MSDTDYLGLQANNLHTALCLGHDCNPDAAPLVSLTGQAPNIARHVTPNAI